MSYTDQPIRRRVERRMRIAFVVIPCILIVSILFATAFSRWRQHRLNEALARVLNSSDSNGDADLAAARALVERGADLGVSNAYGDAFLAEASSRGDESAVQYALRKGCVIDQRNLGGYTPFFYAVRWDRIAVMDLLIDAGADINARDKRGRTPLMRCIIDKSYAAMRHLIKRGADRELTNPQGQTAADIARGRGDRTALRILEGTY